MKDNSEPNDVSSEFLDNILLRELHPINLVDDNMEKSILEADKLPEVSPCEISDELCSVITSEKEKAKKILNKMLYGNVAPTVLNFSGEQLEVLCKNAKQFGFKTVEAYIEYIALNAVLVPTVKI